MVFQWKEGSRFRADAEKVGAEIATLGDTVEPAQVVKKARNKKCELHKCFEWDDSKAAEEFRLNQAREVMRSISVVIEDESDPEEKPMTVRAYEHVYVAADLPDRRVQSVYVPTMKALETPDLREQVQERLSRVIQEAERTAENYAYLNPNFGKVVKSLRAARLAMAQ